jgi:hypothetical protein
MMLRALVKVEDTVGTIDEGQEFQADDAYAARLVESQLAVLKGTRVNWDLLSWPHSKVVIIASGPSLTKEDCSLVQQWRNGKDRRVIVINSSYRLAPWADVLFGSDHRWWNEYYKRVAQEFAGQLWTQQQGWKPYDMANCPLLRVVQSEAKPGLNQRAGFINQGKNSGYMAIGLAYQAGADEIILLGFDMREEGGRKHWHGDHPQGLNSFTDFRVWIREFDQLSKGLKEVGVRVFNATRHSDLKAFPRVALEDALS